MTVPILQSDQFYSTAQTESVYALGFPGEVQYFQDFNTYNSDDVTIANGLVNKVTTIGSVNYIQSSASLEGKFRRSHGR